MFKTTALKLANSIGETGIYSILCRQRLPVFMLHRIYDSENHVVPGAMHARVLRSYLHYLKERNYRVLTMQELWLMLTQHKPIPRKSVMFTIDDGFFDHHDVAAKVFEEFGFALNFFVITGFLDQALWPWDDQVTYAFNHAGRTKAEIRLPSGAAHIVDLTQGDIAVAVHELRDRLKSEPENDLYNWLRKELFTGLSVDFPTDIPSEFRPMSWDDARALMSAGHGVYPHTFSHRILSMLSSEEKQREIEQSLARVSEQLNYQPDVFAYPTGRRPDYDRDDVKQLEQLGFRMAFNTIPSYVDVNQSALELPRFSLPREFDDFRQIVNRFEAVKFRLRSSF